MGLPKFLILFLFAATVAWRQQQFPGLPSLSEGSSLTVEKESDLLVSPNGTFSSGFYKVGTDAYCYAIWFTNSTNKTVAWMANRDEPVSVRGSKLTLHKDGNLVLTDGVGSTVWSTSTFSNAGVEARLLETGNLVLINQSKGVIWQSFDFPTDTVLQSQRIVKKTMLVSMRSQGTYLSGYYNLKFDDTNVLYLIYNGPIISSVYWPSTDATVFYSKRTPYNSSRIAILNEAGQFRSNDNLNFNASDYGVVPKRRLTIDYDGILRLYSLDESTGLWEISWLSRSVKACQVDGLCGEYGAQVVFNSNDPEAERNRNWYMKYLIGFVGSFAVIEALCVGLTWWYLFGKHAHEELSNIAGYMALAMDFKRFTYAELTRATGNFKQKIGKGGFRTPQNILLADHLEPRVADFGMAKLFKDIHGIRDSYLAPEWMMNLKIDVKADVYSYGVVLLELLSGRSASSFLSTGGQYNEYNRLVHWVTEMIREEGLEKVIDPRLHHEFNTKLKRLMKVAMSCVQEDRKARPAMSKVVELLLENDE
ncbi:receptor protein kinase ZmPK1 [Pyrus ussuriensis x Pyrus communis]|uniref:Receptor protein kinase ZmPK1 n=1 Tax=Pyrus ussuriensis x Pyrus communis TaxID=2448454 RepID=A0A5N5HWK5_9ROSA|nr:receptor protein kinase ZmPK1 [Pyrus ussuriensis x Pyrus communis]